MDIRPDGVSEPSSPRLGLDDLGLRLDRPLFARDPGIGNTPSSPNLRELTWDYVVKPANDGSPPPSAPPDDQPVVKPVRIEDLLSEPSAAAALLRRDGPLLEAAGPLGDADEAGPAAAPADEAATPWATDLTPTAAADAPARERADFIARTYTHLGWAVLAFAGLSAILVKTVGPQLTELMASTPMSWADASP